MSQIERVDGQTTVVGDDDLTPEGVCEDLHYCARFGELEDLKTVVEADDTGPLFNIDAVDENDNTALHKAAANGHLDMCKYLVSLKASYLFNKSGACAINWAIVNRQFECAKYLASVFSDVMDVTAKPIGSKSLLTLALDMNDVELQTTFLNHASMKKIEEEAAQAAATAGDDGDDDDGEDDDGHAGGSQTKPKDGEESKADIVIEGEEVEAADDNEEQVGLVYDSEGNVVQNPLTAIDAATSAETGIANLKL